MTMFAQLEAVTNDYFMVEGGKAFDNYFQSHFLLDYFIKQKKGLFKLFGGGRNFRIPFRYDGNEGGFYAKGDTLTSDKREAITAAYFTAKHVYGNGTILRIDTLENAGPEAFVDLVAEEAYGAQSTLSENMADSIYDDAGGSSDRFDGLRATCNETTTTAYGNVTEAECVATDGSYPWMGITDSTTESITLDVIRDTKSLAEYGRGKQEEPDLITTTKAIYNVVKSKLQIQQRFTTEGSKAVKAGFTGLYFEGSDIFPDKSCPSGWMFCINSNHMGIAAYKRGFFERTPWMVIEGSPMDKTMKILFDGNLVCDNRRAHAAHSNLS